MLVVVHFYIQYILTSHNVFVLIFNVFSAIYCIMSVQYIINEFYTMDSNYCYDITNQSVLYTYYV